MGEHTHLPAMMSFMSQHVAQHFRARGPGLSPAVSEKRRDTAVIIQRFGQHFGAGSGAFGQCGAGLLRRGTRAVQLGRNLNMRG